MAQWVWKSSFSNPSEIYLVREPASVPQERRQRRPSSERLTEASMHCKLLRQQQARLRRLQEAHRQVTRHSTSTYHRCVPSQNPILKYSQLHALIAEQQLLALSSVAKKLGHGCEQQCAPYEFSGDVPRNAEPPSLAALPPPPPPPPPPLQVPLLPIDRPMGRVDFNISEHRHIHQESTTVPQVHVQGRWFSPKQGQPDQGDISIQRHTCWPVPGGKSQMSGPLVPQTAGDLQVLLQQP